MVTVETGTGVSADIQARTPNEKGTAMNEQDTHEFINGMADLFAHSTRTPVLRRPDEYGMAYGDVFFPALGGIGSSLPIPTGW